MPFPQSRRRNWRCFRSDVGSAVAEFALITPLLLVVVLGVLQVTLALFIRTSLIAAAEEGARGAALAGSDIGFGQQRAAQLVRSSVAGVGVSDITGRMIAIDGEPVVEMVITAELPLIGFFGPVPMQVTGRAVVEHV